MHPILTLFRILLKATLNMKNCVWTAPAAADWESCFPGKAILYGFVNVFREAFARLPSTSILSGFGFNLGGIWRHFDVKLVKAGSGDWGLFLGAFGRGTGRESNDLSQMPQGGGRSDSGVSEPQGEDNRRGRRRSKTSHACWPQKGRRIYMHIQQIQKYKQIYRLVFIHLSLYMYT